MVLSWNRGKMLLGGAVLVLTLVASFGFQRYLETQRHATRQTLCVHNLKFLASSLSAYAKAHDGRYPDRLADLWPTYIANLEDLVCPEVRAACMRERGVGHPFPAHPDSDTIERLSSYAYVPGHTATDAGDVVVAYEKVDNHFGKGRSLLYLDGHGAWEPPEHWRGGPANKNLPPGF